MIKVKHPLEEMNINQENFIKNVVENDRFMNYCSLMVMLFMFIIA